MNQDITRVAVLWEHVTGYVEAALRALLGDPRVRLFVIQRSEQSNAFFEADLSDRTSFVRLHDRAPDDRTWLADLTAFAPDVTIISGTTDPRYLDAARRMLLAGSIIVRADDRLLRSWWRDDYQAFQGRILRRWRHYQIAFVPGVAGAAYARHIGFPESRIVQGLYSCDTEIFRPVGLARHGAGQSADWPRVFMFLGQFILRKGLDHLLAAYTRYRRLVSQPWELWCVGSGPLAEAIGQTPGVRRYPFQEPHECARLMGEAGALVIPSRWDHWPLVIHEATSAGLPVIASTSCGSARDLVVNAVNGFTFRTGDVASLTELLCQTSADGVARPMGALSQGLARGFSPERFAKTVLETIPSMVRY